MCIRDRDRKGRFPIGDQIGDFCTVEKVPFRSQPFRSSNPIRASHPKSEKIDFFNGMRGSDCSIEKVFANRISHHPTKHTITPHNSSNAGLTATAAAARSESAWHILCSARQQRVLSSDGSSACYHDHFFFQHRYCRCARFGDSRRSPTPQPRR